MSDYTPTTEEIRKYFSDEPLYWIERAKDEWVPSITKELFDRWLAEVKAQVRREERQESMALIGLLLAQAGGEIVISQKTQDLAHVYAIEQERNVVDGSIALRLIKGEEQ